VGDYSGTISAVTGVLAVVTAPIAPLSLALGGVSLATGAIATGRDIAKGEYGAAALDIVGLVPGVGAEVKAGRAAVAARDIEALNPYIRTWSANGWSAGSLLLRRADLRAQVEVLNGWASRWGLTSSIVGWLGVEYSLLSCS
jgi:hypothetical protein